MTGKRPPETPLSRRDMFAQGAGLTLTLAMATAAASSAEAATPVERFSVKDFGAVGDGRTDDTAAIDRAITAAMQARSGIVEIPPGTYSIKELWLGDKSDGRRPSVTGVHIRGAGIGTTILKQRAADRSMGCITLVDCRYCSVRDLTVDSAALGEGPQNGGVLLFGCQGCLLENIEVRRSSHRSISVAGHLFGIASLEARDTVVRGCIAWGQRVWDGNAAAQIIASDGAKTTQFVDCISEASGGWVGDLFGADDAPGTVFRGCRAYGNKTASAGFWVEHHAGERPAFFTDCYVADTRNVGIGGEEGSERMFIHNCYFYRVARNAIIANGVSRVFVDGCFVEECGGSKYETEDAAILLQGDGTIQNTRFVNSTAKFASVNIYTAAPALPRGFARFIGCTFDKDVFIYQNAAQQVAFDSCTFLDNARIRTFNSAKTSVSATMCLFIKQGLELGGVARATIRDSVFRAADNYGGAAVVGKSGQNPITLSDCSFHDYKTVTDGSLVVRARDNEFENCGDTLAAQSRREAVFSTNLSLEGGRRRIIPGTVAGNSYVILVAAKNAGAEGAVFTFTQGPEPRIGTLADAPDNRPGRSFELSIENGMPALSYPSAIEANVTVLRTDVGV